MGCCGGGAFGSPPASTCASAAAPPSAAPTNTCSDALWTCHVSRRCVGRCPRGLWAPTGCSQPATCSACTRLPARQHFVWTTAGWHMMILFCVALCLGSCAQPPGTGEMLTRVRSAASASDAAMASHRTTPLSLCARLSSGLSRTRGGGWVWTVCPRRAWGAPCPFPLPNVPHHGGAPGSKIHRGRGPNGSSLCVRSFPMAGNSARYLCLAQFSPHVCRALNASLEAPAPLAHSCCASAQIPSLSCRYREARRSCTVPH